MLETLILKNNLKTALLCAVLWFGQFSSQAQELNCAAKVSTVQVQSDKTIFVEMEKSINEFMNNTKWTTDVFGPGEKIECSIFLNITKRIGSNDFTASIQVQARRPVFNSSYNSTLILHTEDEITFNYTQFDPLVYTENTYTGELPAILAFYAYMILGTDYDSFSPLGGTPNYEKALNICNLAQTFAKNIGWKAGDDGGKQKGTRYIYVSNLLDQFFKPLRECLYLYHRQGLDVMYDNVELGTTMITQALQKLETIHATKPNNYSFQLFFYAKADELTNIYKSASTEQKTTGVALLKKLNPGNNVKYNRILMN